MQKRLIQAYKAGLRRGLGLLAESHGLFRGKYLESVLLRLKREGKTLSEAIVKVIRMYEKLHSNKMSFNERVDEEDLNKLAEDAAARLFAVFGGDYDEIKKDLVRAFRWT